jgi:uncharacterized membrane protein
MATTARPGPTRRTSRTQRTSSAPRRETIARPSSLEKLRLAHWLSASLALVATGASAIGVFNPGIFRDPPMTAGNAQGTALVILLVAVPALIVSMILEARGSTQGGIVWLGALGYVLYNSVIFSFDAAFTRLFPAYVAMLALALWSLVVLLIQVDTEGLSSRFTPSRNMRMIAVYLVGSAVLFLVTWMRDFVPALIHNTTPDSLDKTLMLSNPIQVMDLSATLPLMILGGIWLWRQRAWGYLLAGTLVVMLTIEALSIAVDQFFGHRHDSTQSLGAVPLMIVFTLIGLWASVTYLREMHNESIEEPE